MNNSLISFKVIHTRLVPKRYKFTHNFFWFKINLDKVDNYPSRLISYNKTGLYSFFDSDHLKLGEKSARDNYIKFAKNSGLDTEVENVTIFTQMRFLGYVFNPVSFILLKDVEGKEHAIIEIGNTFNELKPFFVSNNFFNDAGFTFKTQKFFYISPFIDHDNDMVFKMKRNNEKISISIEDFKGDEKVLQVSFLGSESPVTLRNILIFTLRSPFVTLQFITLIHLHAFVLWLKGIKYFKKDEHTDLQKGAHVWKV